MTGRTANVGGNVVQRAVVVGLVAAVAGLVPVGAQQALTPEQQQVKSQIQLFESVLQRAVRNSGVDFARNHGDFIPPDLLLTSSDAQVVGMAPPQIGSIIFYVQVPAIRYALLSFNAPRTPARTGAPLQPTANSGRGGPSPARAQGLPDADPMTVSPVVDDGRCANRVKPTRGYGDPDYEYAVAVCDALLDAMLENSSALGVKEHEWLTIVAMAEPERPTLIGSATKTYLTIKGADLLAYRQGKLTKDEARRRVDLKLG